MRHKAPFQLQKRGRYWYYRVTLDTGDRIKYSTGKTSKAEALAFCIALVKDGRMPADRITAKAGRDDALTFKEYARREAWWTPSCRYVKEAEALGRRLTERYVASCKGVMERWLVPSFGSCALRDITKDQVERWRFGILEKGEVSAGRVNSILAVLSAMLAQAEREGLLASSPCKGMRRMAGKTGTRGILSLGEAETLFSSLDNWKGNAMAMTANLLASVTGMRSREVAALRGKDIHDGWIHVEHSFNDKYGLCATKTGDVRNIPVPENVLAMLRKLDKGGDAWIFSLDGEKPVSHAYFIVALRSALERIGVDWKGRNICFHSWRHFLNSLLINNNVSSDIARHMTGHGSKGMTELYLHFDPTQFEGVLEVTSKVSEKKMKETAK